MAKSLRSTPGQRQTYNRYDADEIYRAQKAVNERITQMAKTFGKDSQIYRDYIAPLTVGSLIPHVRIDSKGITKFKTGHNNQNADVVHTLERMLEKQTAGEILKRTAEQMDMAINVQHAKATKRKVARREDVITAAKSVHQMELDVYGRLDEIYEKAEEHFEKVYRKNKGIRKNKKLTSAQTKDIKEEAKKYINDTLNRRKFMKDIHASHGKLTSEQLRYADRYLSKKSTDDLLGFDTKSNNKARRGRK